MRSKHEWNALRLLLDKVNMGKRTVSAKEIENMIDEAEKSLYKETSSEEILNFLEKEALICKSGEGIYSIIVDIAALRKAVLAFGEKEKGAESGHGEPAMALERLLNSEWVVDLSGEEPEEDGQGADPEEQDESVDLDDDGMGTAAVEPLDDFGDEEEGEKAPFVLHTVNDSLADGVSVVQSDGKYYLIPAGLKMDGAEVRIRLDVHGGAYSLSDDGAAFRALEKRVPLSREEIGAQIDLIEERYGVKVAENRLQIEVADRKDLFACTMRLFAAMEFIHGIGGEGACVAFGKADGRIWAAAKEFWAAEPDMGRCTLVMRMKERYQGVKDGENLDDILLYAGAAKLFAEMSDEDYGKRRDLLLGREEDADKETEAQERARARNILRAALTKLHINAEVTVVSADETTMRFEAKDRDGFSLVPLVERGRDLAKHLWIKDGVKFCGDPSSGMINIEVPRAAFKRERVSAVDLVQEKDPRWGKKGALFFALGKNSEGEAVYGDLVQLKHILVGGEVFMGKPRCSTP